MMFYVANISNSTVLGISNQKVKEESMIENEIRHAMCLRGETMKGYANTFFA